MMSQYQKRHVWTEKLSKTETASALSNETDTSGRTKAIQKHHEGTENFWKTEKKLLWFQTKIDSLDGAWKYKLGRNQENEVYGNAKFALGNSWGFKD